jgi:hypothetical protein
MPDCGLDRRFRLGIGAPPRHLGIALLADGGYA